MTPLPPGWRLCTLDDVKAPGPHAIAGGPFGSDLGRADYILPGEPGEPGVPVIRGSNLGAGERRFYTDDLVFIREAKADALTRHTARPDDVIITQRGTLEQVGLVPAGTPWPRFILSQSQMKITLDRELADPEYIYYWLLTPEVRDYVARHTISAGVPHTNLAILRATPLRLPPLAQQRAIARALAIVDARAELAQTMDHELDRLVRLLFRTWFFEHAPTDSRAAGALHVATSASEAALFPDTREPGPIGPLPTGWRAVPLPECASFQNGTPFTGDDFGRTGHGKPVIKIGEIKRGVTEQTRWAEDPPGARAIDDGDLLMSWSGNPYSSIGTFLWHGGPAWLNQHIFKVVPPAPCWRAFTYCLLRELQPRFVQLARSRQTTGLGHVSQKDMATLIVPRPPETLAEAFERRTAPAFARIAAHGLLARTLARTRETLLVKLTSGELPASRLP